TTKCAAEPLSISWQHLGFLSPESALLGKLAPPRRTTHAESWHVPFQALAQSIASAHQARLHRPNRNTHHVGDLLVRKLFNVAQIHVVPIGLGGARNLKLDARFSSSS